MQKHRRVSALHPEMLEPQNRPEKTGFGDVAGNMAGGHRGLADHAFPEPVGADSQAREGNIRWLQNRSCLKLPADAASRHPTCKFPQKRIFAGKRTIYGESVRSRTDSTNVGIKLETMAGPPRA